MMVYVLITRDNYWLVVRERGGTKKGSDTFIALFVVVI